MSKSKILIGALPAILILSFFVGCSNTISADVPDMDYIPYAETPDEYSLEEAKTDAETPDEYSLEDAKTYAEIPDEYSIEDVKTDTLVACSDSNEVIGTRGLFFGNEVEIRNNALIGENSVSVAADDFVITLNTDQKVYSTTDIVNIWGTIEYVGDEDNVAVFHGQFPLHIWVSDGEYDFGVGRPDVGRGSVFERGRVYHFNYPRIAGTDDQGKPFGRAYIDREEGIYRVPGFLCEDYLFKPGEYTVGLFSQLSDWDEWVAFSTGRIDRSDRSDPIEFRAELTFTVIEE